MLALSKNYGLKIRSSKIDRPSAVKDLPKKTFNQQIKSAFSEQAHYDERPAKTNLPKPADIICISSSSAL